MARKVPIVIDISRKITLIQTAVFVLLLLPLVYKYDSAIPLFIFIAVYYAWFFIPLWLVCPDMMKAEEKVKKGIFEDVIPLYRKSYDFLNKHPWIDKYKSILFLSPIGMSFKELCLVNIANAYVQLGQKKEGKKEYQKILELYPDNYMAIDAMKFLD